MGGRDARREGKETRRQPEIPALEWAAAALGALLLAGAIAFMLRQAMVSEDAPGPVRLAVTQVRQVGEGFLVEIEARNAGDATYAELELEGTLRGPGGEERARATLDYLPGRSSREAGLFFREDPRRGKLELAAKGFRLP